jgi:hypothetical protein
MDVSARGICVECVHLHQGDAASMSMGCAGFVLQACKALVTKKNVGRDDELVLESVLGEGSYGKVRTPSIAAQPVSGRCLVAGKQHPCPFRVPLAYTCTVRVMLLACAPGS